MRGRWLRRGLAPALVVALVIAALAGPVPGTAATGNRLTEGFDSRQWYEQWGLDRAPWNTEVISDSGGGHLRVRFAAGGFSGTSWKLPLGSSTSATLQYKIRFGTTWLPMPGQAGKLPGFGLPRYWDGGRCAEACGLQPVTGPHYSARASFDASNTGGSYVYTPQCGDTQRLVGANQRWDAPAFERNRWHLIEQRIVMNTPGVADGILQAWVDEKKVYDSGPAFCFRSAEHPGIGIGSAWMELYFGGKLPTPLPTWVDLDDIEITW